MIPCRRPRTNNAARRRSTEEREAEANIDDVFENVTAAVKRSNGVIIVTTWIVNLHFSVASARSAGCNSGRCFVFVLFFFYFTVRNYCGSLSLLELAHTVPRLSKQAFDLEGFVKLNLHQRATAAQLSGGRGKHVERVAAFQQSPDVGIKRSFHHVFTCVSSETITCQLMSPRCGLRRGQI